MKHFLILAVLVIPSVTFAQKLPPGFTCQDLIDTSEGRISRSTDGGRTYVPIKTPQPKDAIGAALLSHDTQLCYRLSRREITVDQFNALHDEKVHQLRGERERVLVNRQTLGDQEQILRNQQSAIQTQREAVQVQREAVHVQRQAATIQALQAEAARQQQERQHQERMQQQQIQQRQLEQIRREQAQPKTFSCFGGAGAIYCN